MSLVIALWSDIFISYIPLNPISTFVHHFYPGDLTNCAGSINSINIFFIAALMI